MHTMLALGSASAKAKKVIEAGGYDMWRTEHIAAHPLHASFIGSGPSNRPIPDNESPGLESRLRAAEDAADSDISS